MTKLKQPIVLTIETVDEAISVFWRLNIGIDRNCKITPVPQWVLTNINWHNTKHFGVLAEALKQAGIDPNQKPPAPLTVGNYEVEALEGGSIKVGCTTVNRPTLEAIWKLSSEAMGRAEPEWPKYYQCNKCVIRFDNATDFGTWECNCTSEKVSNSWNLELVTKNSNFKPLTPAAAREILEAKG